MQILNIWKENIRWLVLFTLFLFFACYPKERLYYIAPSLLPNTKPEMKTAGYWISRNPYPDKLIMTPKEIKCFNTYIRDELKLVKDISNYPQTMEREEILTLLEKTFHYIVKKHYYKANGKKASFNFFKKIKENMNLSSIPEKINVCFGFIVRYANQRLLPTNQALYRKKGDIEFDRLQNSALDIGTPLAILHISKDKKWYFVESPLSIGWVEVDKVAICSLEELKQYLNPDKFIVVIKPKADIFLNPSLTFHYGYVRMGVKFPLKKEDKEIVEIIIPKRKKDGTLKLILAYMKKKDVHKGYLPYTPRNIIEQAFSLLNAPYGWGGMYGEQDCSRFIQEIFATVGINMPRNSTDQAKVGELIARFDEKTKEEEKIKIILSRAIGGITTLRLKGHIMLYLGSVNGRPYVIHETWGYKEKGFLRDRVRVINKVVISDLSLGKDSKNGSLLKRIDTVRLIKR